MYFVVTLIIFVVAIAQLVTSIKTCKNLADCSEIEEMYKKLNEVWKAYLNQDPDFGSISGDDYLDFAVNTAIYINHNNLYVSEREACERATIEANKMRKKCAFGSDFDAPYEMLDTSASSNEFKEITIDEFIELF